MKTMKLAALLSAILMVNTMQPMMRSSMVHLKQGGALSRFAATCKKYMEYILDPQKPQPLSVEQPIVAEEPIRHFDPYDPEYDPYSKEREARRDEILRQQERERVERTRLLKQLSRDQETKRILAQKKFEIAQAESYIRRR